MTAAVPTSSLTSDQLLKLANFRRELADDLDAALTNADFGAGVRAVEYTATGAEPPGGFVVPIGDTIAGTYRVSFLGVEADIIVPWAWSFTTKTTTTFTARFTGDALTAGGVYYFMIIEAT